MSGQSSSSSSYGGDTADTGTGTAAATTATNTATTSVVRWEPHGRGLTACLIAVNVAVVALIYLYFWRFFTRKRSASDGDDDDDEDASSSVSAPSPPRNQNEHLQRHHQDRLIASLPPPFVVRAGEKKKAQQHGDCAVCIAELAAGDEARALPRCGHRFHAACVDAWLRRHTTCPLCRASVFVAAGTAGGPKGGVTDTTASDVEDMDAPV